MPRIITGTAKGLNLESPKTARPITDRMKAALFSMLADDIKDKRILDLYAGSGSLGIEALSRGSKSCTFIDQSKFAETAISKNIEKANLHEESTIIIQEAFPFLHSQNPNSFDIVFADPPYEFYETPGNPTEGLIDSIETIIPPGGAVILKHPSNLEIPEIQNMKLAESRIYGNNALSIWVKIVGMKPQE